MPERTTFNGRAVHLEPLAAKHVPELWSAAQGADESWAYLRYGPFSSEAEMSVLVDDLIGRVDQPFWAVRPFHSGTAEGWLSLCDIYKVDGAIEIGSIWFSPRLQRTRAATEAMFLLMSYAVDALGYQRLVWRCSASNAASLRAAARFGFKKEGIWRDAAFSKGRRLDVAWHSIIHPEWHDRRAAILAWLADENFDGAGLQRQSLNALE